MALKKYMAIIASFAFLSTGACSETYSNINVGPSVFVLKSNEEDGDLQTSNDGLFCGARIEAEYAAPESYYLALVGVYAPGTQSSEHVMSYGEFGDATSTMQVTTKLWQVEGKVGKQLKLKDSSFVIPYVAVGTYNTESSIAYKDLDAEKAKTSAVKMTWQYVGLGAYGSMSLSENLEVGMGLKILRHFKSTSEVALNGAVSESSLDSLYGYECNAPVKFWTGPESSWQLQAEPFYLKIDINRDVAVYGARFSVQRSF